jgi:glucokinase
MSEPLHNRSWLIADVGATNTRCGLLYPPAFDITAARQFLNNESESLQEILASYLLDADASPTHCALAIAAPVDGDVVRMSNRDWQFDVKEVSRRIGVERTDVINDFHAVGYALPLIDSKQRIEIGHATSYRNGSLAVLGPGSGLGMSAWIEGDSEGVAVSGEGGHVTLTARNENEDSIIAKLRERFDHCSAERVLSGPGIINLHNVMHEVDGLSSEEISQRTLTTGAIGGVYVAGGIVPDCIEQIAQSDFRSRFEDKDDYRDYMRGIPTWVITDPYPGLTGLTAYVRRKS